MDFFNDIHFIHGGCTGFSRGTIRLDHKNYYCLQYNHAGRIRVRVGDRPEETVNGPSLLFTYPGISFRFGTGDETVWNHNYLAFNGPRVDRYLAAGLLDRESPIALIANGERFLSIFSECVAAIRRGGAGNAVAAHALEGLLLQVHEEKRMRGAGSELEARVRAMIDRVQANPEQDWDFHGEAKALHISGGHLRRLMRGQTGIAPGLLLIQARLARAAERLAQNEGSIKEIAAAVGIPDIHYFTKLFRRRYGLPPARFRRELRGA